MAAQMKKIQASELKKILSGGSVEMIDVREPVEFQAEKIEGAKNIPLSSFEKKTSEIAKEKAVYLLCRGGNRACQAAEKLGNLGYENVFVIEGGLEACKQQGIPVTAGVTNVWALDRQVRFSAGLLVLAGIILSWLFHPGWMGLSAFVGAGLVFSGVTNTCGMGMMLAKMPWNQTGASSCSIKK